MAEPEGWVAGEGVPGKGERLDALILHDDDDVATALRPLAAGTSIVVGGPSGRHRLDLAAAIPLGHKFALRAMPEGRVLRKYGEAIGRLCAPVVAGGWVHVHNLQTLAFEHLPGQDGPARGAKTPGEA